MAVDVIAGIEVHLRAPVTAKPLSEVWFGKATAGSACRCLQRA
jgi:hypothetical protein